MNRLGLIDYLPPILLLIIVIISNSKFPAKSETDSRLFAQTLTSRHDVDEDDEVNESYICCFFSNFKLK